MRYVFAVLLSAAVLTLATGCGKKSTDSGSPTPTPNPTNTPVASALKIEGTYVLTGMTFGGVDAMEQDSKVEETVKITADKIYMNKAGKEDSSPSTYKLDASKTPAHIDTVEIVNGKEAKTFGIVKLDGDTLTASMTDEADKRPKDFTPGPGYITMTMKKKK